MKKVKYCKICNGILDTTGKYCQKCYNYLRNHPEGIYPLPPKGEICYAPNGDVICHICGMAYRKLGNHIRFKHNLSQVEYRELFKLYHNTKLSNIDYRDKMRLYNNRYYDKVVKKNLIEHGANTRTTNVTIPKRKLGGYIKENYL